MTNWYLIYVYAFGVSWALSLGLTAVVRRLAIRLNVLDHPGERKMQNAPMPLLGGVAIWITFWAVVGVHFLLIPPASQMGFSWLESNVLAFLGHGVRMKLAGMAAGGLLVFVLGVVDDLVALRPEVKLVGQILAALALVLSGIRLDLFIPDVLDHTVWAHLASGAVTVVWVVMMMNSMNFLDNMDGLCAGVSVISAGSFFLCVFSQEEYFVCLLLAVFAGSVLGFLFHNFNPARIFMGDAGAMFCGYILATVAILGTFYTAKMPSRISVAAPLLALSVPLFDTLSVVYIRWRSGESIMKGDKRHFSHRLVELGMTPRQAVEFIYLVATVAGLGAALLPHVGKLGTVVIVIQTIGLFSLIVLLMRAGKAGAPPQGNG